MSEEWPKPIKTYFETVDYLRKTLKEYPQFKQMWIKDIKNEFMKEYKKDEFAILYKTEIEIVQKIAERAAHNFFDQLLNK